MTWPATALAAAEPTVFWLDDPARPALLPRLEGSVEADLLVVGGGYGGLWTALRAVERDPGRSVVVVEAGRCGDEASGRNGGFASSSLTHGFGNGVERWPDELALLDELGAENLRGIADTIARHGIDCHWEETGELSVAAQPHQVDELVELADAMTAAGHAVELLDGPGVRAHVDSPTYLGGLLDRTGTALVEPARLAWGLRRACLDLGVVIHEGSPVLSLGEEGSTLVARTARGSVRARQVALATNAFRPLLRRLRLMAVPVYDHVLMTEPLSVSQQAAIGWAGREGVGDCANQFHYYRQTRDGRILWGGYDAVYHYGSRIVAVARTVRPHPRAARRAVLRDVPAARGAAVRPPVGWRHRHLHPLHGVLRHRVRRPRGLRPRLHRPRRRRHPLRRRRRARPARRRPHPAHRARDGAPQAAPVPARAGARPRHQPDPLVDGPRRPQRGAPQPVAAGAGRRGAGLRQLSCPR